VKHQIAIPFRGQRVRMSDSDPFLSSSIEAVNGYQNPSFSSWLSELMQQWTNKAKLLPATSSLSPVPHAGLGLSAYCQATSPIRRYADLLVHYQIKAVLRGEVPLSHDHLLPMLEQLEVVHSELNKLSAYSQRYWVLRYFERQSADRVFLALVLSVHNEFVQQQKQQHKHYAVQLLLLDLGYKMNTSLFRSHSPKCGELVHLTVGQVDAFYNDISFIVCS